MCKEIIKLALEEDLHPHGDLSSLLLADANKTAEARIIAKVDGVMACSWVIQSIIKAYREILEKQNLDSQGLFAEIQVHFKDGEKFKCGQIICSIKASAILLLGSERTILNFLQRLCGIATATKKLNDLIKNYPCKLLDTRKTMPGLRALEKEAFRAGGGTNHRFNLSDMVMLKENHLAVLGLDLLAGINEIRQKLNDRGLANTTIEVEINKDNLDKLPQILQSPIDVIMLDNFKPEELTRLVKKIRGTSVIKIEASGSIKEDNILSYAATGVDYISTSSVFTNVSNLDLSLIIKAL